MRINHTVLIGASLALMISFLGCGGGSSHSAPALSNLSYAPNQATLGSGGGTITIYGTADAVDTDGDMSTITFTSYDSHGNVIHTSTDPISPVFFSDRYTDPGTQASITMSGSMDTTTKGIYTFKIYVTDSTGLQSNVLTGTLSVI